MHKISIAFVIILFLVCGIIYAFQETFVITTPKPINLIIFYSNNRQICNTDLCNIQNIVKIITAFRGKTTKKGRSINIIYKNFDTLSAQDKIKYNLVAPPFNRFPALRIDDNGFIISVDPVVNSLTSITNYLNNVIAIQ